MVITRAQDAPDATVRRSWHSDQPFDPITASCVFRCDRGLRHCDQIAASDRHSIKVPSENARLRALRNGRGSFCFRKPFHRLFALCGHRWLDIGAH